MLSFQNIDLNLIKEGFDGEIIRSVGKGSAIQTPKCLRSRSLHMHNLRTRAAFSLLRAAGKPFRARVNLF